MTTTVRQPLETIVDAAAQVTVLDELGTQLGKAVRGLGPSALKDVLSGTWMGHALHPLLTDVVIGSWTSASLLDVFGGRESDIAARRLIAIGIAAYPPTALTGLTDWADSESVDDEVRRVGLVHAASNAVALGLYAASLSSRRRGRRGAGIALALAGAGAMSAGGWLGGHLAFRLGVGVDQTAFDKGPGDWTDALAANDLGADPVGVEIGDPATPVLVFRDGGDVLALHDRCTHRGCPLSTLGELEDGVMTCTCHGSRFDARTGAILHGPATAPQPAYETRTQGGRIEVRLPSE
jgi:nitrite reductase/ring-hydroxylating ferredoxin subunit/uncharacterized membrane protein